MVLSPKYMLSKYIFGMSCFSRPVRMTMTLSDNLNVVGKRAPFIAKYKVNTYLLW